MPGFFSANGATTIQEFSWFDPGGIYGSVFGGSAGATGWVEFGNYQALYSHYKVTKIVIRMIASRSPDAVGTDTELWPDLVWFHRHMYEDNYATSYNSFRTLPNVKRMQFDHTHPMHQVTIYPRTMNFVGTVTAKDASGAEAPLSCYFTKQRYTDAQWPTPLVGCVDYMQVPVGFHVQADIEYHMKFKNKN